MSNHIPSSRSESAHSWFIHWCGLSVRPPVSADSCTSGELRLLCLLFISDKCSALIWMHVYCTQSRVNQSPSVLITSRFSHLFFFFHYGDKTKHVQEMVNKWEMSFSLSILFSSSLDISPPAQGVDHRHVQKELGEVIVRLHNPVVLSPTTIQVSWTVCAPCFLANEIQFD